MAGRTGRRPLTPAELAAQTGTAERYAVEWLEMQAVYGNVVVEDDATTRRVAATRCRRRLPRC